MNDRTRSYEKVHYEFRPAKQVERRMLVDTFQSLMALGFPISEYKYVGFGSVYFIDFILFHRYLGIRRFLSVEKYDDIRKRIRFNRPFGCVEVGFGDIIEHVPRLSLDVPHILWLDYDNVMDSDVLSCVKLAASQLCTGSILLVTIEVEPPGSPEEGLTRWNPRTWRRYFLDEGSDFIWPNAKVREFTREALPKSNARLVDRAIARGLLGRGDVAFYPLFSFIYADTSRMLSLGGMIGTEGDGRLLRALDKGALEFLRTDLTGEPYEIVVPRITRRERLYLDHNMPCKDKWTPKFEMKAEDVEAYRRIYRYYPAYTEMLL